MIEILGTKITIFTLYGLVSLQVLAVLCGVFAYRVRKVRDSNAVFDPVVIFGFMAVVFEIIMLCWMGEIK